MAGNISIVVGRGQRSLQNLLAEGGEVLFPMPTWRGKKEMGLNCKNKWLDTEIVERWNR